MSAATPPVNDQYIFRRPEFEELLSENQNTRGTPQPVHSARQTALHQQQHRVKQNSTS